DLESSKAHYKNEKNKESWYKHPLAPNVRSGNPPLEKSMPTYRLNNTLTVELVPHVDSDNHWGDFSEEEVKLRLYQNDDLVGETNDYNYKSLNQFPISSKKSNY